MKANKVKMNESQLREFVSKVIKESLEELGGEGDFQPNGYKTMNNHGGNEIQVNKGGRFRKDKVSERRGD